jgi:hypothetical protein
MLLHDVNAATHQSMPAIIERLPADVVKPVTGYPGFMETLEKYGDKSNGILAALKKRL